LARSSASTALHIWTQICSLAPPPTAASWHLEARQPWQTSINVEPPPTGLHPPPTTWTRAP
jgi:hypothetical protein